MDRLVQDLRIALRRLRGSPTFTATAVLILGLGIGMAVAMSTVFDAVLVRSLPVHDQDRIVLPRTIDAGGVDVGVTQPELAEWLRRSRTIRDAAGVFHPGATSEAFMDGDRPIVLNLASVTHNFFDVLGARPALGRFLRPDDEGAGAGWGGAVVISYDTWQRRFGGDSGVLGHQFVEPLAQSRFTIVGVAPAGLDYPLGVECWRSVPTAWLALQDWDAVARLLPTASPTTARSEFLLIMQQIDRQRSYRQTDPGSRLVTGATIQTFTQAVIGGVRPALRVLTGAVALLLLIACVNVGTLLVLRATARGREIAIRRSLGANSADIARALLVESASLGLAGGVLGLACAVGCLRVLLPLLPPGFPRGDVIRLAGAPVVTALGVTLVSVVVVGVLPVVTGAGGAFESPLRHNARSGGGSVARRRLRQWLVACQVALAVVMLTGAGLVARSLERLGQIPLGYRSDHLSLLQLAIPVTRETAHAKLAELADQATARWRTDPNVVAVTPSQFPPFLGAQVMAAGWEAEGELPASAGGNPTIPIEIGDADYFRTFDVPILRGRGFLEADREHTPPVVVVSDAVARLFWPGKDPIGRRIHIAGDTASSDAVWRTVVGVAGDIRYRSLRHATPTIYLPWHQADATTVLIAVRTRAALARVLPELRRELVEVDPRATVVRARTMDELLAGQLALPRFNALLLTSFGLVALLLVAAGLYGVMASVVREETHEIGVRMALGATPNRLLRGVLGQALAISGAGAIVGLAGALATSRLVRSLLFEVSPTDPAVLLGACMLLLVVAAIATYVPARYASTVDPARALQME